MIRKHHGLLAVVALCAIATTSGCGLVAGLQDIELADAQASADASTAGDAGDAGDGADTAATDDGRSRADASLVDAGFEAERPDATVGEPEPEPDDEPEPDPVGGGRGPGGCRGADFASNDRRADDASRTITFGLRQLAGHGYDPPCMRIRVGQTVTWEGDFRAYPLMPRGDDETANPIHATSTGTSVSFTFPAEGRFRFGSPGGPGMRGVIDVRP